MSVVCEAEPGDTDRATALGLRLIVVKEEGEEENVFNEEGEGEFIIPGSLRSEDTLRENHTERKGPKDDHYLYCEECKNFFLGECQLHGPPIFIPDTPVDLGVSDRARRTLPHGLEFRRSQIPGEELGVFNCGEVVSKGSYYGPYEGEVMEKEEALESGDCWVIRKSRDYTEYISAKGDTHSNWMRYVRCARTEEEQNLVAFYYNGGILYRCCRPIAVGEELLVWYGQEYRHKSTFFQYFWNTKEAMLELSQTPVFSCCTCTFSSISQIDLQKHVKKSHEDLYVSLLRSREVKAETLPSSKSLPNTTSNTPTSTPTLSQREADKLSQRVHTEEKPYHCDHCGKNFPGSANLIQHLRFHSGEKPHQCDQCGKKFSRRSDLRTHQEVHTKKLYNCDQCGKNFTTDCLRTHQRSCTGGKPYQCDQCGKNFNAKNKLTTHQRIHLGEKPYHCDQCGKNFTTAGILKTHQRSHTGEKPYSCDQCGKKFGQSDSLKRHQLVHTGEKPYHCDQCSKNYSDKSTLRRHQRVHTGLKP